MRTYCKPDAGPTATTSVTFFHLARSVQAGGLDMGGVAAFSTPLDLARPVGMIWAGGVAAFSTPLGPSRPAGMIWAAGVAASHDGGSE